MARKRKELGSLITRIAETDARLARMISQAMEPDGSDYPQGTKVLNREGTEAGHTTGKFRRCRLEGCTGLAIAVKWPDGKTTYPCSKGLTQDGDHYQIG